MWNRQQRHDVREALFGGKKSVRVWDLAPSPALPFAAVLACELEPGGSVGTHRQEHFPEVVIGVEGKGSVLVNGSRTELGSGGVVELPLGHTLSITNESDREPLRYLIVKARGPA
jgi:quercetin dioxygenase-like cupin family protein